MKNGLRFSATVVTGLWSCLAALGCPGSLADKECFLQEERARTILVASCAYGGCHSEKDKSTGLDLESPGAGKRLSSKAALTCDGNLIDAGKPDASVIYTKLSDPPPCGSRMPLAHPELAEEDKAIIRAWIVGLDGSCSGAGGGAGGTGGSGGTTTTTTTSNTGATGQGGSGATFGGSGGSGGSGATAGSGATGGSGGSGATAGSFP